MTDMIAPAEPTPPRPLEIPELALVVLIGASGAGKSTFAARHFLPTEILSSDQMRGWVADNEASMEATGDAFDVLHYLASVRLKRGLLTVVDATNVRREDRAPLVAMARKHHALPLAVVLDVPAGVCEARNRSRPDRVMGSHVVRNHVRSLRIALKTLKREGFSQIIRLRTEEIDQVTVQRQPLWTRKYRHDCGPFDIVGDIHGCADELIELLDRLGYVRNGDHGFHHPLGRKVVFLGDLVDRGPRVLDVLRIVMAMTAAGNAYCVAGNHDVKLLRKLQGKEVRIAHGLAETLAQIDSLPEAERDELLPKVSTFLDGLISHYVLDEGRLVVAHAGMKEAYQGRASPPIRDFALYGETTGEIDEFGLPVRMNWAEEYRGTATVVHGHVAVPRSEWLNNTIDIDTGCVFGGSLTALRWPERDLVQIQAKAQYSKPIRPWQTDAPARMRREDLLDIDDVIGKRVVNTRLAGNVVVREEHAAAALEVMSRFAMDSRWLIYLPPTIAPCETSTRDGFLEHPDQAFSFYRDAGIAQVLCEEKHMGSRAILVLCKDTDAAAQRFGIESGEIGACYTRTGREFFANELMREAVLTRAVAAVTHAGLWELLETDWLCLDCEIMPWNLKGEELLTRQYAPVAVAGELALDEVNKVLEQAVSRGLDLDGDRQEAITLRRNIERFRAAYQPYCWPVRGMEDVRIAPFHLLASAGGVHVQRSHRWHMETLALLANADPALFLATQHREVDLFDAASIEAATGWWLAMTNAGGEGMVVKPMDFVVRGSRGLIQPAIKCRGPEYLRIIYGPDYTSPANLQRLRQRGTSHKRSLAVREFGLGIEALERFVRGEALSKIHECVFAVLAMESEPVDPRL